MFHVEQFMERNGLVMEIYSFNMTDNREKVISDLVSVYEADVEQWNLKIEDSVE